MSARSIDSILRTKAATERSSVLLRLDRAVRDALAKWAADELRSSNAQIEFLLRDALARAGRLSGRTGSRLASVSDSKTRSVRRRKAG